MIGKQLSTVILTEKEGKSLFHLPSKWGGGGPGGGSGVIINPWGGGIMGLGGKIADTGDIAMGGIGGNGGRGGTTVVVTGVEVGGTGGTGGLVVAVVVVLDVEVGWDDAADEAAVVVEVAVVFEEEIVMSLIGGAEEAAVDTGPESWGFDGPILSFSSSGLKHLKWKNIYSIFKFYIIYKVVKKSLF